MLLVSIELGGAPPPPPRPGPPPTRALSGAHQGTDAGSRDVELGNAMKQEAAGRARAQFGDLKHASSRHQRREYDRRRRGAAWPRHHDKVTEVHQLPPAAPRRESVQGVHADDERKRSIAQLLPQRKHGIYHVRGTRPAQLALVDAQARLAADREAQHGKPMLRMRARRGAMGRDTAGDEPHVIEAELVQQVHRRPQMAEMDGIEGTAEETDHESASTSDARGGERMPKTCAGQGATS